MPELEHIPEEALEALADVIQCVRQDEACLEEMQNLQFGMLAWRYKNKSPRHPLMQEKLESKGEASGPEVKKYPELLGPAKQKEICSWREAKVCRAELYDPQKHGDQPLPGRWVPTVAERGPMTKKKPTKVKMRWTIRGDLCPYRNRSDSSSPASSRTGELYVHSWCTRTTYKQFCLDIKTAFLRGERVRRMIAMWPPPEAGVPEGTVWILEVYAYGLAEAQKEWNSALDKTIMKLGCRRSTRELVLYYFKGQKTGRTIGVLILHIDDILGGGGTLFYVSVIEPLMKTYPFGEKQEVRFKFTGIGIEEVRGGCTISQKTYIQQLKSVPVDSSRRDEDDLDWYEQTGHRSLQGRESWVCVRTRADGAFEASAGASKNTAGKIADLRQLNRHLKYLKSTAETALVSPGLGEEGQDENQHLRWLVVCEIALLNIGKAKSQQGVLIWLTLDRETDAQPGPGHLLYWLSKKGDRLEIASLSAQTHVVQKAIGIVPFLNDLHAEIAGKHLPADVRNDAESLMAHLDTCKRPRYLRLYADVARIREDREKGTIRNIKHLRDEDNLADVLTKRTAPKEKREKLIIVMTTGMLKHWH